MLSLVLLVLAVSHADKVLDALKVPTSNWASVYSSDNTDYREPVSEASAYPIAESASRSDWFESYPYQKFEEKTARMADPGILETVGDTIEETVGSVRNGVSGFGGGIVNGALRLVGAETLREKQEKARRGFHVRGPNYQPGGQPLNRDTTDIPGDGNTVRPQVVGGGDDKPALEKLRLGIRSYLDPLVDPVVDPIKNLLKSDTKIETQHDRRAQQVFPNPISGLKDFGKHVAGGFSKLTGISASSKVSNMLFPWLSEDGLEPTGQVGILPPVHNTQARQIHHDILSEESVDHAHYAQETDLPLLPPVFIFPPAPAAVPAPQQFAQDSNIVAHRVPAPVPALHPGGDEPGQTATHVLHNIQPDSFHASRPDNYRQKIKPPPYPKKVIYPPLYPKLKVRPPPYHPNEILDTPYPYQIMITPILEEHIRSKKETPADALEKLRLGIRSYLDPLVDPIVEPILGLDQLVSGSSRSLTKNLPKISEPTSQAAYPLPFQTQDVIYYLPSPDLSSGREHPPLPASNIAEPEQTILLPDNYFEEEIVEIVEDVQPKYKRKVSNIFIENTDSSDEEFAEVTPDDDHADITLAGTNIEIDLRSGDIKGGAEPTETEDGDINNQKPFKKVRKQKLSTTLNMEPEDTIVFDISQEWDDILKEGVDDVSNALDTEVDEAESEEMQEESPEEE